MKKILLTTCLCVLAAAVFAPGVFAQGGSTITIIHEDGSKDVIDLGTSAKPAPAPEVVQEAYPEAIPDVAPAPDPIPEGVAEPAPMEPPKAPVEPVPAPEIVAEPEPEQVVEESAPKPAPKKAAAPKPVKKADVPKPRRKPYRAVEGETPAETAAMPQVPAAISRDKAVYIALEAAPPSRDVEVIERANEYAVLFKTEEGVYEVLVDRQSGVILSTQMLENVRNTVPPGHLPARVNLPKD